MFNVMVMNTQDYYDEIRQQQLKELGIIIPDKRTGTSSCSERSTSEMKVLPSTTTNERTTASAGSTSSSRGSSSCSLSDDDDHYFSPSTLDPHFSSTLSSPPSFSRPQTATPVSHVSTSNQNTSSSNNHYNHHHHEGQSSFGNVRHSLQNSSSSNHSSISVLLPAKSSSFTPVVATSTLKALSCSRHGHGSLKSSHHSHRRHHHHVTVKPYDLTHKHQSNNHNVHRTPTTLASQISLQSTVMASSLPQYENIQIQQHYHSEPSSCSCRCQMDISEDNQRPQTFLPFPSSLPVRESCSPKNTDSNICSNTCSSTCSNTCSHIPSPPSASCILASSCTTRGLSVCTSVTTDALTSREEASGRRSPYTDLPSGSTTTTTNSARETLLSRTMDEKRRSASRESLCSDVLPIDSCHAKTEPSARVLNSNAESRVTTFDTNNFLSFNSITQEPGVQIEEDVVKVVAAAAVTAQKESLGSLWRHKHLKFCVWWSHPKWRQNHHYNEKTSEENVTERRRQE